MTAGPALEDMIEALGRAAERLRWSVGRVRHAFPLSAGGAAAASPELMNDLDALLHRYETVVATLQDQVFRAITLAEGEGDKAITNRDRANLMEKLGAIDSADTFFALVVMRNRLSHEYPSDHQRIAARLNDVWSLLPTALHMAETAIDYTQRRLKSPQR